MSNILQFSLGLTTGSFLSAAEGALGKIHGLGRAALSLPGLGIAVGGLLSGVSSLHSILENTFAQFEKGAELAKLAKQTSESAQNLFVLEKGFKAVHVASEMVGPSIFQMQKALGGFNEMGAPTKDIFAGMGLSVDELKKGGPVAAIQQVLGKLGGLAPDEAAKAASGIFGRGGAREMLVAARSMNEMGEAMRAAAPQAEIMGRNAGAFERIEVALTKLKGRTQGLFLGLAEGIAPGVTAGLEALNKINLTGLGQRIGHIFAGLGESFAQNRFGEIFELSMKAGITAVANFTKQTLTPAVSPWLRAMGFGPVDMSGFQGTTREKTAFLARLGQAFAEDDAARTGQAAAKNPFAEQLQALLAGLSKDALGRIQDAGGEAAPAARLAGIENEKIRAVRSSDSNALERIGLVRFGGGTGEDYQRQTALNTGRQVTSLDRLNATLDRISNKSEIGDPFANL